MPLVKDKYGKTWNLKYKYAVQLGRHYKFKGKVYWSTFYNSWNTYKSIESCLQGLKDLKQAHGDYFTNNFNPPLIFRPIHYEYRWK